MVTDSASRQLALQQSITVGFSPEQRLIVECIRRAFGQESQPDSEPGQAPLGWELVLRLASQYGLTPIVHSGLASLGFPVPPRIMAVLKAGCLAAEMRSRSWLEPTLHRTLDILGSLGIEPIVLKGMALAYTVYPEPGYRTMADIDLLLPDETLDRASKALRRWGFWTGDADPLPAHHLRAHHAPRGEALVELHRQMLPEPGPFVLDVEDLRRRAEIANIAGVEAHVLAPSDALLFECLHLAYAHRYRWFPLRSMTDILAITAHDDQRLDWDLFLQTVQRSRAAGAVYWPLWLSRAWLGAPVPEMVLDALAPSPLIRKLVGEIVEPEYLLDNQAPGSPGSAVLYRLLLELSLYSGCSARAQLGALLRGLFPPPEDVGHLPPAVTSSRLRYTACLTNPARVFRGVIASYRLVLRRPVHRTPNH